LNPRQYIKNDYIKYGLYLPDFIDRRAALLSLDPTIEKAYDPYAFIRDAYLQRRAFLVSDGKIEPDNSLVDPGDDPAR
jgi:phospholipid-binding lipoprotein MlaA